jgi:hypothetical protein
MGNPKLWKIMKYNVTVDYVLAFKTFAGEPPHFK